MMAQTHLAFGLFCALLLFSLVHQNFWVFIPLFLFGSLLPDVDHEKSKINRWVPVTRWIPWLFKHRGFFHSIFPAVLLFGFLHVKNLDVVGMPLAAGYVSHLISDCATNLGCNLLHPFAKFRISGFIKTGGLLEQVFFGVFLFLDFLMLLARF